MEAFRPMASRNEHHRRRSSRSTYFGVAGRLHCGVRIQATLITLKIEGFHPCRCRQNDEKSISLQLRSSFV